MITKEAITNFGVPSILKDRDIKFCFSDSLGDRSLIGIGCHIKPDKDSVKFFLYDQNSHESIFTMDFYIRKHSSRAFPDNDNGNSTLYLQHIGTNQELRKNGIATFYMSKLVEFCTNNNIKSITLNIAVPSKKLKNALSKSELIKFYKSFATNDVDIRII
ncbi:GNAT family N-acetyltransferase [Enterococcus plantarum]|uniref:GNAT family N-acetyltransferase n=1 Tax=Enterococcus plantarum TaxID=1077675 RepID=A0A2W3YVS9_9ENTE|nr:GNAT family N-acetyltransferase [Enterococcus plantarum]MBO0423873.1 GNAT family N-acetyltransferase [Enterococcus plantarum]PZL71701.1 GNAT family N-acetyltransferase [Enterococcus plantarum]